MKEKFIKFKNYKISLWEDGKGQPVILLHGLGASKEWWKYNFPFLSKHFKVIVPDIIGFGHSDKPEISYNLDLANNFLNSLIESFNFHKVSLIGNSMGGLISLYFALNFPDRLNKLVLVSNAGFSRNLSLILRIATISSN